MPYCTDSDLLPYVGRTLKHLQHSQGPVKVRWESITKVIDVLSPYGTFGGCLAEEWVPY